MEKREWVSPEVQSLNVIKTENIFMGTGEDIYAVGPGKGVFGSKAGYTWDDEKKEWIPN